MNVPFFKIRCDGFPYMNLGMKILYSIPCCLSDSSAMALGQNEQKFQLTFSCLFVNRQHYAAHLLPIQENAVRLGILPINGILNSLSGNNLLAFFCSVIAHTKFYLGSISERPLIVLNELFPVIFLQWKEGNICFYIVHVYCYLTWNLLVLLLNNRNDKFRFLCLLMLQIYKELSEKKAFGKEIICGKEKKKLFFQIFHLKCLREFMVFCNFANRKEVLLQPTNFDLDSPSRRRVVFLTGSLTIIF